MIKSATFDKEEARINSLQLSTRSILQSFTDKAASLSSHSDVIKKLLRQGYDIEVAKKVAHRLFGSEGISFIAIDGTKAQDQELDMLLFYSGAFAYSGKVEFAEKGCKCREVIEAQNVSDVSTAIPLYEEDASMVVGDETEGGLEVNSEQLPSNLMHLSEYFLAIKLIKENQDLKLIVLDRTLAGDVGHLIWSVRDIVRNHKCVLEGVGTELGIVSALDLELARILHPNQNLNIPAPRSQFIKYCAINMLLSNTGEINSTRNQYEEILSKIGAKPGRLTKLVNDLTSFNKEYPFLKPDLGKGLHIKDTVKQYWERVFSAAVAIAEHIFHTPPGQHPLLYEVSTNNDKSKEVKSVKKWITSRDLEYITLIMIYALLRLAWEKNILVIGLIKDTGASELTKIVVPLLGNKTHMSSSLPKFNSDKQLLQTFSVVQGKTIKSPWRTIEFDACFRTIVPYFKDQMIEGNPPNVTGAFKNIISGERMFVKAYIQLWQSDNDHTVRSHVFSYDRPCYPNFDISGEVSLLHKDDKVIEEINPMIHFDKDSGISHLVMDVLCSMASEVIPECLGHNYPLFLADKKAKYVLEQMRTNYLSTIAFELANNDLNQQILYEEKFRDYRSKIERSRRS